MQVKFVDFGSQYRAHKDEYDEAIHKCLEGGKFILQSELEEFEQNLAQFLGMKYVVGTADGTNALILAMTALEDKMPRNALVTDYTFKATHEALFHTQHIPDRVDIEWETRMPDLDVHIPVHIEGMVSQSQNAILEDACQALGAKGVGYSGTACYSFYPAKILGCFGDGGAIATNDKDVYEKVKLLRHHWQTGNNEEYGFNSRLDNVQAAFLNVKLKYLPEILARRKEIAERYKELDGYVGLPFYQEGRVWQDYVITTPKAKELADYLKSKDIQTLGQGMIPPHKAIGLETELPNTTKLYSEMMRLPCNETVTNEQVEYVIEKIKEFYVSTVQ